MSNQKVTDSKSLFSFITEQMQLLSDGTITVEAATAQAKLSKAAIHVLVYEVNKAAILLEIEQAQSKVKFNEIASK